MKPLDYVLIVALVAIIGTAIYFTIKNARSGKGCCGKCSRCKQCKTENKAKKKK